MVFRVEVGLNEEVKDAQGLTWKRRIETDLGIKTVDDVKVLKVYLIDCENVTAQQVSAFAAEVLADPVTEVFETREILADNYHFDWIVETGYLPGVTDNEGKTALWGLKTFLGKIGENDMVFSGRKYLISGKISEDEIKKIASDLLANGVIQRYSILSSKQWKKGQRIGDAVPRVVDKTQPVVEKMALDVSDEDLMKISRSRVLALNIDEMKAIRDYFKREDVIKNRIAHGMSAEATDCEVEVFAQTWSEHCKHKIFAADIKYEDKTAEKNEEIHSLYKSCIT